jgi:tRNA threonylcarbamoyl adenosine modification protein YeaZ
MNKTILFINTSRTNLIEVKLIKNGKIISRQESHKEYKHSELLLTMIDKVIKSIRSVKFIAVVSGPGTFSALRLGVTTANALAWSLKMPLIEISAEEAIDEKKLIMILKRKIKDKKFMSNKFKPIIPKYGKEPNITQTKDEF